MERPLIVSFDLISSEKRNSILKNRLERVSTDSTFETILESISRKHSIPQDDVQVDLQVFVSSTLTRDGEVEVDVKETLSFVSELLVPKSLYFVGTRRVSEAVENEPSTNAFDLMMSTSYRRLQGKAGDNMRVQLHNKVLQDMQGDGKIVKARVLQKEGERVFQKLTDALWYLDGRKEILNDQSRKRKIGEIEPTPERFNVYSKYQDWVKWKQKPRLNATECEYHASSLIEAVNNDSINWPRSWKDDIIALSSSLSSYSKWLKSSNDNQQARQSLLHPVRQLHENAKGRYWPCVDRAKVHKDLSFLSEFMESLDDYDPVLLEDEHFPPDISPSFRYQLMNNIALAVPVQALQYNAGGGSSVLTFLQKVPALFNEDDKLTQFMRMLRKIEDQVPVYHTRAMRKQFAKEVGSLHQTEIKPHVRRHIYRTLTGDTSCEIDGSDIDKRVKLAIETDDPDLILDLKHLNKGRPGDTFTEFFKELAIQVEQITAVDDRRHGIAHMSEFLSIRDLIDRVKSKLPEGTPIPSESTVIHSFAPPNMYDKTAQYYTGKINLKHAVQRRQLRSYHTDAHYCSALYKYLRERAIKDRDQTVFVSCDDKAKVDFGEPGATISSGVRGKKSIVPTTTTLGALDHDVNQKGNIIPSVFLIGDIPEDVSGSFYRGKVHVTLKENVFQPSDSYRATVELMKVLDQENVDWTVMRQLFLMTDGGPEHRVNFESVKVPLIMMFKKLNLDLLVAIRTAPGQSYLNIVERLMSIMNIGLQNLALERPETPSDDTIKLCKTLEDLRSKTGIKQDWQKSVSELIAVLEDRIKRLQLKDIPFQVCAAATDDELKDFIEDTSEIDQRLPSRKHDKKLAKKDVSDCTDYQDFLKNHCFCGHYSFQIRRCNDESCCPGGKRNVPWLPQPIPDKARPGHYQKFEDVFGKNPTDEFIPSFMNDVRKVAEEQQGCKSSALTAQNVRTTVTCRSCKKVRCIYAKRVLTVRETNEIRRIIRDFDYICGCIITPDTSFLCGTVFSRLELSCASPIEFMFYGAPKLNVRKDLCAHCAAPRSKVDEQLKREYKTVLPICDKCKGRGKEVIKKGKVKTAVANKRIKLSK